MKKQKESFAYVSLGQRIKVEWKVYLLAHAAGVFYGSKNAERINQGMLKKGIAVFSILIAGCRLSGVL